jgi:hypothetical protein
MVTWLQKKEQVKWNRRKQHVKKYIDEGLTMVEIAKKFGCGRETLTRQATRMGLYTPAKKTVKKPVVKTCWIGGSPFLNDIKLKGIKNGN